MVVTFDLLQQKNQPLKILQTFPKIVLYQEE
jgi:hypothetical protein